MIFVFVCANTILYGIPLQSLTDEKHCVISGNGKKWMPYLWPQQSSWGIKVTRYTSFVPLWCGFLLIYKSHADYITLFGTDSGKYLVMPPFSFFLLIILLVITLVQINLRQTLRFWYRIYSLKNHICFYISQSISCHISSFPWFTQLSCSHQYCVQAVAYISLLLLLGWLFYVIFVCFLGNRAVQCKLYSDAIELYSCAISLCENNAVYYCNRCTTDPLYYAYSQYMNLSHGNLSSACTYVWGLRECALCQFV